MHWIMWILPIKHNVIRMVAIFLSISQGGVQAILSGPRSRESAAPISLDDSKGIFRPFREQRLPAAVPEIVIR